MEDVGRVPADVAPVQTEPATRSTLEQWIENLMNCKQLSEADVQRLCDMVSLCCCWLTTRAKEGLATSRLQSCKAAKPSRRHHLARVTLFQTSLKIDADFLAVV